MRCFTKNGPDWTDRYPGIVAAALTLKAQAFLIDGEVVVVRPDGLSDFNALISRRQDQPTKFVGMSGTGLTSRKGVP